MTVRTLSLEWLTLHCEEGGLTAFVSSHCVRSLYIHIFFFFFLVPFGSAVNLQILTSNPTLLENLMV